MNAILKARALLAEVTPLKRNCGRLCGAACCQSDETGENGMLLLPGEEALYGQEIPGFPLRLIPDDSLFPGGKRLVCEGHCPREHRPFACRVFPLRVRITPDGCRAEIDPESWAVCPLPDRGGLRAMDPAFIAAAEEAGRVLCGDERVREALLRRQERMDAERHL